MNSKIYVRDNLRLSWRGDCQNNLICILLLYYLLEYWTGLLSSHTKYIFVVHGPAWSNIYFYFLIYTYECFYFFLILCRGNKMYIYIFYYKNMFLLLMYNKGTIIIIVKKKNFCCINLIYILHNCNLNYF